MSEDAPSICQVGGGGLVLPLFGDSEQEWPRGLRAVLYLVGLFWTFVGVAIIADVFMGAIEKVTSKKIRKFNKSTGRWYTYEVWNATVSNLTLMALGSSAPEILLNVIDIFAKDFYLEGLGPGTIVGSAAFNLLMIIAVCILCIPSPEIRKIKEMQVYKVTASWSLFAYIWLVVILMGISPNVVDVWEGVLTFLFFPILVFWAWAADKGYFQGEKEKPLQIHADMTADEIAEVEAKVRAEHGKQLTSEQIVRLLAATSTKPRSRAAYRVAAMRKMTGSKPIKKTTKASFKSLSFLGLGNKVVPVSEDIEEMPVCTFSFATQKYAVLECAGQVKMKVIRHGDQNVKASVRFTTKDGSASKEKDYIHVDQTLVFEIGESEKEVCVTVIDDESYEEDEEFYGQLLDAQTIGSAQKAGIGDIPEATVTIIDDDEPGVIAFEQEDSKVIQGDDDMVHKVCVVRRNGACGEVKVQYKTEPGSALADRDFVPCSGELVFEDKQVEAYISVTIKAAPRYDQVDVFRLVLSEPEGGAKMDWTTDGGPESCIMTISIAADDETQARIASVKNTIQLKWSKSMIGHANWASQFKAAVKVNGGEEDDEPPSLMDWALHVVSLFWKLIFALVPPTDYCGGWLCFYCALIMIGLVTMIIGDLASLLGCVLCIPDDVTAITFVALGTSLPDTFASKTAAQQDPYADASVGNVTGSNSVNVFLGLGLPWMIASIFWALGLRKSEWQARYDPQALTPSLADVSYDLSHLGAAGSRSVGFVVPAGSLGMSVTFFVICAVLCLGILQVRRVVCGGELGGPPGLKYLSAAALCLLWFTYVGLSTVVSLSENPPSC